ncbi:MAG TPA: hypothetical protein VFV48_09450, partial [Pseudomonadales bacterium]|nr:hypothetical protein [Pseudomonadales bacterium]
IKSESVSLEQKLDLRLNQLRSKLEEKPVEETDTDHGTASRTMTLITTGLSVLAIVVSVASYFLK